MAAPQVLIVLAMASSAVGSDFDVECTSLAQPTPADHALHAYVTEVDDPLYKRATSVGSIYRFSKWVGFASYAMQFFNVVRDGVNEWSYRGSHVKTWEDFWLAVIDPNVISLVTSGLSFWILQQFYEKLYAQTPMGVFTVETQRIDGSGNPSCQRYGVIADDARAGLQFGTCHQFPVHVRGCKEENLGHTWMMLGLEKTCDESDPIIVQQTLFGGKSAAFLQVAFFLGCLLRFFDAMTTLFFQTIKYGFYWPCCGSQAPPKELRGTSIEEWPTWLKRIIRKFAVLRGYKQDYIKGLRGGVYDLRNYEGLRCCGASMPTCCNCTMPGLLDMLGWKARCISNIASDCLFAVLTMTSLHASVEDGCVAMNTSMGFSFLALWAYFFIIVVLAVFLIIAIIVVYNSGQGLYIYCCLDAQSAGEGSRQFSWMFPIFAWCCYVLTFVSILGFLFNMGTLFYDGDLPGRAAAGVLLEAFGMLGEIAEGYQDAKEGEDKEGEDRE